MEVGEKELVKRIKGVIRDCPDKYTQNEEDAEVFKNGLVVSVDSSVGAYHFLTKDPKLLAHKAVVSSVTDVIAKGALPKYYAACVGVPKEYTASFVEELVKAADKKCEEFGMFFTGGDTSEAAEFFIASTVIGKLVKKPLLRSSAKVGDKVVLTGEVGNAACGYLALKNSWDCDEVFKNAQLAPEIDYALCKKIIPTAHAGIDISDGLGFELNEVADQSSVGMVLREDALPVNAKLREFASAHNIDWKELVFHHGEDYQIAFCGDGSQGIVIGEVVKGSGVLLGGQRVKKRGWEHFK